MEGYGTTIQRLPTPAPPPSGSHDHCESNDSTKTLYTLTFPFPFNIPSTPESAAARIIKNLGTFSLYYAIFVWTVLFITLVPECKVSIVYLAATTEVAFLYVLLLRAFPSYALLHKRIDRRFVLFLLFVICGVEMILTRAGIHFFVTIAATVPVVLHAALSKTEGGSVNWDVENELSGPLDHCRQNEQKHNLAQNWPSFLRTMSKSIWAMINPSKICI